MPDDAVPDDAMRVDPRTDPRTDRERLTTKAYADSGALRQRIGLYDYQLDSVDLPTWVFDQLEIPHAARVVDVGCGPGLYLNALRVQRPDAIGFGFDLSVGMAREAAGFAGSAVGDATHLPARAASAHIVLAAHMLYHVDDMPGAIDEFARVVRSDGAVAVVVNGSRHLDEIFVLLCDAAAAAGGTAVIPSRTYERARIDVVQPLMAQRFARVEVFERLGRIVVPNADPVVNYLDSMESFYGVEVAAEWQEVLRGARELVVQTIERDGAWTTQSHCGVILGRDPYDREL